MPIKDPVKRREYYRKYNQDQSRKEAVAKYNAEYYQDNKEVLLTNHAETYQANKQNITYIITLGSEFYFGHTSTGLDQRKYGHFHDLKRGKGSVGLRKRFNELGEEAFKNIFDIQILGTYDTKEEAAEQERYLLSKYVGTAGCLNVSVH